TPRTHTLSLHDALPIFVILLIVAVAILLFLLIRYFRPSVSPTAAREPDLVDSSITAEQYLASAQRYLASGDLGQAYVHAYRSIRSEEHTSELQSRFDLV